MFGCQLCLPIDFYFPMRRSMTKHHYVDHYVTKLYEWLQEVFKEAQVQSTSEVERQEHYYDRKANAISLEPVDLVLAKANTYRGQRKVKDQLEEEPYEVGARLLKVSLPTSQETSRQDVHDFSTKTDFFSLLPQRGFPLCMVMWVKQARWTTTTLEEQTPEESETEEVQQSVNCPSLAQHQKGEMPLGWVNRKLHTFIWTFSRASLLDQGWKVWCRGIRSVWKSTSVFWQQKYWSHQWDSKRYDQLRYLQPHLSSVKRLQAHNLGARNRGASPCIKVWGAYFIPNTDALRTPGIPHARDPYQSCPVKLVEKSYSES